MTIPHEVEAREEHASNDIEMPVPRLPVPGIVDFASIHHHTSWHLRPNLSAARDLVFANSHSDKMNTSSEF